MHVDADVKLLRTRVTPGIRSPLPDRGPNCDPCFLSILVAVRLRVGCLDEGREMPGTPELDLYAGQLSTLSACDHGVIFPSRLNARIL